jgi:hypothetical protein
MVVKFEVQARKKPKLNRFMDIMDFQLILLTCMVIPFALWYIFGITWAYTFWLGLSYILWMMKFKIDKPNGYWGHWLNYQLRGKTWSTFKPEPPPLRFTGLKAIRRTRS